MLTAGRNFRVGIRIREGVQPKILVALAPTLLNYVKYIPCLGKVFLQSLCKIPDKGQIERRQAQ